MNYSGKTPLTMNCPYCDAYAAHPVIRTEAKIYYWDEAATSMFEKIVGKDISFRRRVKRCVKCGRQFFSVEMANMFLKALIEHAQQLETSLDTTLSLLRSASAERDKLAADQKDTYKAIRAASKVLHRRLPRRKSH
jgi:transcriptional regulator NrdR family protein